MAKAWFFLREEKMDEVWGEQRSLSSVAKRPTAKRTCARGLWRTEARKNEVTGPGRARDHNA